MIKSFRHKGLELFYLTGSTKGIQAIHQNRLKMILNRLDNMKIIEDINFPASRLHRLKGNMRNLWSVTVQANWRVTFEFIDGNVYIIDYQDYH